MWAAVEHVQYIKAILWRHMDKVCKVTDFVLVNCPPTLCQKLFRKSFMFHKYLLCDHMGADSANDTGYFCKTKVSLRHIIVLVLSSSCLILIPKLRVWSFNQKKNIDIVVLFFIVLKRKCPYWERTCCILWFVYPLVLYWSFHFRDHRFAYPRT